MAIQSWATTCTLTLTVFCTHRHKHLPQLWGKLDELTSKGFPEVTKPEDEDELAQQSRGWLRQLEVEGSSQCSARYKGM